MGPFVITAPIADVAGWLDFVSHFSHVCLVLYMSLLCKFVVSEDVVVTPEPIEVKDTLGYMVEFLLQYRRGVQGGWEFFVWWEGYSASEDT